jgi:ABC-type branched-subunit amino acid transport system ATPase component/ABC-type branched-subunit amino acid transport system permease subunit
VLVILAVWLLPYVLLGLVRFGWNRTELGSPLSWLLGFSGLQLFATIGIAGSITRARALLAAAALFYAIYFSGVVPGFAPVSSVAPQLCIAALMALSVWLPFSSGQLSLAQAGFMAIGAYGSAWLTVKEHWPFLFALPAAALATAAIGLVASYPALRLRGIYLAIATLGFGEVIRIFFLNFEPTGGAFGFAGIPKYTTLGQLLVALAVVVILLFLLMRSRMGRAIAAVRHDEVAASVLGIEVTRIRMLTFTLGALLAGLAGGFQAHYVRFISPENYGLEALIESLAAVMLGGFQTFLGPLAGAVVLGTAPELLRFLFEWRLATYGAILVALLLLRPEGMITRDLLAWSFARGRMRGDPPVPSAKVQIEGGSGDLLVVRDISKSFGAIAAIDRVSFAVRRGTIHALIGPNGAGKTTLFNIISGLYSADAGEMLLRGSAVHRLRPQQVARAGIARTFQNVRLFGEMTVLENVLIGGHVLGKSGALRCALRLDVGEEQKAVARAIHLLGVLGLAAHAARPAKTLSYGDQRRVEIARALASDPELVLLDEPAAGMNDAETATLGAFIRRIAAELGKTILIIEHDMTLVMGLCDHVTVLNFGTLIADGSPSAVQRDEAVIRAYLGATEAADKSPAVPLLPERRSAQRRPIVLEVDNLATCYGRIEALKGIRFTVGEGETVALIGANGAGKTTALLTVSGVLWPARGVVKLRGEIISGLPPQIIMRRGLAQVVEGRGIFKELTVLENLAVGAYVRRDRQAIQRDIAALLTRFPRLAERRQQRAGTLSGGEQQMLAIARALVSRPQILLLDEPSMGLAPLIVDEVFELVEEIKREGTTIVLVEQNAVRALEVSDRAYVMANGRIVAEGASSQLLADEQLRSAYLGGD